MTKLIPYSKIRPETDVLCDGKMQPVVRVERDPLYTTMHLPYSIVQRPNDWLAAVNRPRKARSRPPCPPLTARLTPGQRAWVLETCAIEKCSPQELLAIALQDYKAAREAPAPKRRWWSRRKRASSWPSATTT